MGFWTFVGLAVVCGCLLEAYRIYVKSKSRTSKADVERLEARLAGLESSGNLEERGSCLGSHRHRPEIPT